LFFADDDGGSSRASIAHIGKWNFSLRQEDLPSWLRVGVKKPGGVSQGPFAITGTDTASLFVFVTVRAELRPDGCEYALLCSAKTSSARSSSSRDLSSAASFSL
jgi:hypothetical protein